VLWIRNGFNANPDLDPAFCLNADLDLDPPFCLIADPDMDPNPGSQINAAP
jgi:hypothetical protein